MRTLGLLVVAGIGVSIAGPVLPEPDRLTVRVHDSRGRNVGFARVRLQLHPDDGARRLYLVGATDDEGVVVFDDLPEGDGLLRQTPFNGPGAEAAPVRVAGHVEHTLTVRGPLAHEGRFAPSPSEAQIVALESAFVVAR